MVGQIIYYLTRYYSSTGSAAAALIVSIKQPPLSLSVSNYAIIGFLLSSTQLCKTLDFCYHGSVTHAGISPYGRVKYGRILDMPPSRRPRRDSTETNRNAFNHECIHMSIHTK